MTTIKLKKAIFDNEIWNKIKEALDEHYGMYQKEKLIDQIDDQSVQKSFTTTGDAPFTVLCSFERQKYRKKWQEKQLMMSRCTSTF